MGVWEAMEMLNTLVDESDPDVSSVPLPSTPDVSFLMQQLYCQTSLSQIEHLLQTAEAIRRDGKPEWMQVSNSVTVPDLMSRLTFYRSIKVAGLVHDLGKLLLLFGSEGQWDVVGVSRL
jgi:inositol oxygenase